MALNYNMGDQTLELETVLLRQPYSTSMIENALDKYFLCQLIGTGEFGPQIWQTEPLTLHTTQCHHRSGSRGGARC